MIKLDSKKIAAQMYSLRKEFEQDPDHTLKTLKEIGFQAIQLDGMRGHNPFYIKELVDKYGFEIAGMHIKHDRFIDDLDGIIKECYLFNCKTIYNKYIDEEYQTTKGYQQTKESMLKAVEKLSRLGFRLGIHCPEYDYTEEVNGYQILDYFTQPENGLTLYAEPDTYWIHMSGLDVYKEFEKFRKISPIVHLKNCIAETKDKDEAYNMTELDTGVIDIKSIVKLGIENNVEYFCVEQDHSKIGMFDSMKQGFDYLVSLDV